MDILRWIHNELSDEEERIWNDLLSKIRTGMEHESIVYTYWWN